MFYFENDYFQQKNYSVTFGVALPAVSSFKTHGRSFFWLFFLFDKLLCVSIVKLIKLRIGTNEQINFDRLKA